MDILSTVDGVGAQLDAAGAGASAGAGAGDGTGAWGQSRWWRRCAAGSDPHTGRVRGRALRYLLSMTLHDAQRPMTVSELVAHCERTGVIFEGRASKIVSDSLRWEIAWGRVRRLGRGVYRFGKIPRSTLRFIRRRLAEFLQLLNDPPPQARSQPLGWSTEPPGGLRTPGEPAGDHPGDCGGGTGRGAGPPLRPAPG